MKKLLIGLFVFSFIIVGFKVQAESFQPSITVISPNGGETIQVGQKYNIRWDSDNFDSNSDITINLKYYGISCGSAPMVGCQTQFYIDTVKNTGSYLWDTSKKMSGASTGPNSVSVVSGSRYVIELSSSSGIKDESDNYFTTTSSVSNNPVISGVKGPQILKVDQKGEWEVKASAPTGGNLSYYVVWGDEPLYSTSTTSIMPPIKDYQQSATFTHSYGRVGTFTPVFRVTSENTVRCITTPCPSNGGSAETSLSVKVLDSTEKEIKGCLPGFKFSPMTGLPCSTELVNDGCLPGYKFSPMTGEICPVVDDDKKDDKKICTEPGSNCGVRNYGISRTLKHGIKGDDVKLLQAILEILEDGSFGPMTKQKLIEWQKENGLTPDGVFGIESRHKVGFED